MSRNTLDYRLSKGWTPEEAVGLDPRPSHAANTPGIPVKVCGREFKTIKEAAKFYDRAYTNVIERRKAGCTIEQALGLVERTDSLQTEYPDIAKQWHPIKNESLAADKVAPHSGKKVWWLCPNGHEWKAAINSRTRGTGCPTCAGVQRSKRLGQDFAIAFPDLLNEWNIEKNHPKGPEDFTPRSNSKVWWKCEKGHSWQATIVNRTRDISKGSCPYCSNRKLCDDNSLAQVRPDIAQDWHPQKNGTLTPKDVIAGGGKRVWWACKHGHEWKTTVGLRVNAGTGCPKCSNQTSRIEITVYSELCALFTDVDWQRKIAGYECDVYLPEKKIGIEIDGVYWHKGKSEKDLAKSVALESEGAQLFRLREEGLQPLSQRDTSFKSSEDRFLIVSRLVDRFLTHARLSDEQSLILRQYVDGPGLVNEKLYRKMVASLPAPPPGQSLADKQPQIAKEWAYDLNAPLSPEHFRHQASKKVWWRCANGHTWQVSINNRTQHGTGCPSCPRPMFKVTDGRNLAVLNPELSKEWHPDKNGDLRPEDVRPKSNYKVWWQCDKGHEWQADVGSRASGHGCPYCYGRFASETNNFAIKYPELLPEWDMQKNEGLDPSEFTPYVNRKVWWVCKKGHSWQATIGNRTRNGSGCPTCARTARRKYTIADFQAIAEKRGGKCLSSKYTSSRKKLKFECGDGHIWKTRADSLLYTSKWCPICGQNARNSRESDRFQLRLDLDD